MDLLSRDLRTTTLGRYTSREDDYDVPPPRHARSENNLLDRVPPPPQSHKMSVASEAKQAYLNLPSYAKPEHASSIEDLETQIPVAGDDDIYDIPPSHSDDAHILAMSPPPPAHCNVVRHSYVNAKAQEHVQQSMYIPMDKDGPQGMAHPPPHLQDDYATHDPLAEDIYSAPPSNEPVPAPRVPAPHRPPVTPAQIPPRSPAMQPSIPERSPVLQANTNVPVAGARKYAEKKNVITVQASTRTKSFRREINRDKIQLPIKRRETNSSSESDDESHSSGSHDHSSESLTTGHQRGYPPPPLPIQSLSKNSLNSTPPPPKKSGEVQYLDLALEESSDPERSPGAVSRPSCHGNSSPTDYKEIDFIKTKALTATRRDLENQRKSSDRSMDE